MEHRYIDSMKYFKGAPKITRFHGSIYLYSVNPIQRLHLQKKLYSVDKLQATRICDQSGISPIPVNELTIVLLEFVLAIPKLAVQHSSRVFVNLSLALV